MRALLTTLAVFGVLAPLSAAPPVHTLPWNATVPLWWDVGGTSGRPLLQIHVGSVVVRYPCASAPQARREGARLSARLAVVAATRGSLSDVAVGRCEAGPALLWRGRVVMTASRAQAADLGMSSPEALVSAWVAALRSAARATALPTALPRDVSLAVGDSAVLPLPGVWAGCAVDAPGTVSVKITGPLLTVGGRSAGVHVLRLRKGRLEEELRVRVLDRAGRLPGQAVAEISGDASDDEFMLDALERAVEGASRPAVGASLHLFLQEGRARPGTTSRLTAWLEGPGLWAVSSPVRVYVAASTERFHEPAHLAASNHPERIEQDGILLQTALQTGNNAFYFHHQNAPQAPPRWLTVRVENRSASPADLLIMESGAGPSRDELYAGHLATWRYVRWMAGGNGLRMRLEPGETCTLDERLLGARDVGCGLGLVMVLRGTPPALVVEARAAGPAEHFDPGEQPATPAPSPAANVIRGRGLFGRPVRDISAAYSVGGPYAFVPVGGPPYLEPIGEGTPNVGNYGVEHRIRLRMANPTSEPRRVYVVFAVGGGVARGSLVVDGKLVQTSLLRTGALREFPLVDHTLGPGEERTVEIRAVPEPGSNYPVRIIAKPLPANQ